jgi:hypothetical protein
MLVPVPQMSDRELIYWANQYGQGIVIKDGDLQRKIRLAARLVGETPEEFVMNAIGWKINE